MGGPDGGEGGRTSPGTPSPKAGKAMYPTASAQLARRPDCLWCSRFARSPKCAATHLRAYYA